MEQTPDRSWTAAANRLGAEAMRTGEPTQWAEDLWQAAERDEVDAPWDHEDPHPAVARMIDTLGPGNGRRAVVVGAALGADAEALARAGWEVTAFDVSPSAVRLVRSRYPSSPVGYRIADLLDLPEELVEAFDLVVEVFTVQAMPPMVREAATRAIRSLIAPGGAAVVVQHVRGGSDPDVGPPWMLDRAQISAFGEGAVTVTSLDEVVGIGGHPIWVARLERAS